MNIEAVRRFAELDMKRKAAEADAQAYKEELDRLAPAILEEIAAHPEEWSMNKEGLPQMRLDVNGDKILVHLHRQIWAKCVDQNWPRAVAALREAGLDEYVETKYNTTVFSAYLRELDRAGQPLPESFAGAIESEVRLTLRTRR